MPRFLVGVLALALFLAACAPAATAPTPAAPKSAAPTAQAAKPAAEQAAKPAPTSAPERASDEQAVADFYKGNTIRIVVGFAPGGVYDVSSRVIARHMSRYLPGNPNVIVENKPGAGSILAANAVYKTEPKDGTVIGSVNSSLALLQALGADGIEFDVTRFQWLAAGSKTPTACAARLDSGITSIQEIIDGKELVVGTIGPGTPPHDVPAVLNAALGTNFKLVSGYKGGTEIRLAVERKEVDGLCIIADGWTGSFGEMLKGPEATVKLLVITGAEPPDHPVFKGVPGAETLAKTEDAKQMLRAIAAPEQITRPLVVAPEVPKERVAALSKALAQTFSDQDVRAEMQKAGLDVSPTSAEATTEIVQGVLKTPPAVLAKLREVLVK